MIRLSSEERFRTLVDNLQDVIMRFDRQYRHLYVNKSVVRETGIPLERFIGKTHEELGFPVNLCQLWEEAIHKVFSSGHVERIEFELPSHIWIDWVLMPEFGKNDTVDFVIAVARDITRIKQAEMALAKTNQDLLDANRLLKETQARLIQQEKLAGIGQLAAGVAHELNNPIGFISGNFDSLASYFRIIKEYIASLEEIKKRATVNADGDLHLAVTAADELKKKSKLDFILKDIADLFGESKNGIERITSIVQNLRKFAYIDSENRLEDYDINAAVEATLVVARNEIKYVAEVENQLGEVPAIECIGGEINQVLLNVLVNAAQAIKSQKRREKGRIGIRTYADSGYVYCEISDDGPGIPREIIGKIFDPFFTTKEAGKGTGLGLNISYDIVINKHKGDLAVKSEPGQGALFTIKLPIRSPLRNLQEKGKAG